MNLRPATLTDIDQICSLYRQMYYDMALLQPDHYVPSDPDRDAVASQISHPDGAMLVVTNTSGTAVGFLLIRERKTVQPHMSADRFAAIEAYSVHSTEQRSEIGNMLVEGAIEWARDRGLSHLELNILNQDGFRAGILEDAGFSTTACVMRRAL